MIDNWQKFKFVLIEIRHSNIPKVIQKLAKKRSKAPPKLRFRPCILCPKRVILPTQLCNKCDNRARALTGPNAGAIEKDLFDILTQDRRAAAVEKFVQTHSKKIGKL